MDWKTKTAILLGAYANNSGNETAQQDYFSLTSTASAFDFSLKGALIRALVEDGPFRPGQTVKEVQIRDPLLIHLAAKYGGIYVVNLGKKKEAGGGLQNVGAKFRHLSRTLMDAIRYVFTQRYATVLVESFDSPRVAGTSVAFARHLQDGSSLPRTDLFDEFDLQSRAEFENGLVLAEGQILSSELARSSSVAEFVQKTKGCLRGSEVDVVQREEAWIRARTMGALLSVSLPGSSPVVLELVLRTKQTEKPLVIVAKGTPYETSLLGDKPLFYDKPRRNGLAGASCVVGALHALSRMNAASVNVHCVLALVWNRHHPEETEMEDAFVVQATNGAWIEVEDPSADSRLVLADVLAYSQTLDPCAVVDIATLSSNVDTLVGSSCCVFFTSRDRLKTALLRAAESSGEKVWAMPLVDHFRRCLKIAARSDVDHTRNCLKGDRSDVDRNRDCLKVATRSDVDRISNVGSEPNKAVLYKAVSFLREFVGEDLPWLHVDASALAGSRGRTDSAVGRPARLVAEFCLEYFRSCENGNSS